MDTSRRLSVGQTSVSREPQTQGEGAPLPKLASTGDWREPAGQQRWGLAAPWGPAGTPMPSLDPKSKAKGLKPLGEGQDPPFLGMQQKHYCPASVGGEGVLLAQGHGQRHPASGGRFKHSLPALKKGQKPSWAEDTVPVQRGGQLLLGKKGAGMPRKPPRALSLGLRLDQEDGERPTPTTSLHQATSNRSLLGGVGGGRQGEPLRAMDTQDC